MGNDSLCPPNKLKKAAGWLRSGSSIFLLQILTTGVEPTLNRANQALKMRFKTSEGAKQDTQI